jgi:hypothetical protein
MLTAITTVVMAVVTAIVSKGMDFGILFSGILVGLTIIFEVSDFGENQRLKWLKASLSTHLKIFIIMFFAFFVLKMLSLI